VTKRADELWQMIETGTTWGAAVIKAGGNAEGGAVKLALRDRRGEALRARLTPEDWRALQALTVEIHELLPVTLEGGRMAPGAALWSGLEEIKSIRMEPKGRAVAFAVNQGPDRDKDSRLLVAAFGQPGVAAIAEHAAGDPDWTPDGSALVYVQAAGVESGKDDLRLATLVRRGVLGGDGAVRVAETPDELAGLVFQDSTRVRCLRDGRILFNSVAFTLPVTTKDVDADHETLFAADPGRQPTLVRLVPRGEARQLPKNLTFFTPDPAETRLLIGGLDGEVCVLTLASGEVEQVQKAGDYGLMAAPAWRNAEEFTYARRNPSPDGKAPARPAEVVRHRLGAAAPAEVELSRGWTTEFLTGVFSKSEKGK